MIPISRPARFRRSRVLIVGCGDVGVRSLSGLRHAVVRVLSSSAGRLPGLRAQGVTPLLGNLDEPATLARLSGLATRVLHLAPPPSSGRSDPRTRHLLQALARRGGVRSLVYGSTSGVYGDAQGARFDETRAVHPTTDRAWRRVDAERQVRLWGRQHSAASGTRACILRIPGIYALDREGGDPRDRVRRGAPLLAPADDVYTNHIHADDLARACVLALWRGRPGRVLHVSDDTELCMGEYFDVVADGFGLPRAPRLSRDEARTQLSAMQWSFMSESRRLVNQRLKTELRLVLRHATVQDGLGLRAAPQHT